MWWAWGIHRAVDYLATDAARRRQADRRRRPLAAWQGRAVGRRVRRPHRADHRQPGGLRRQRAEPPPRPPSRDGQDHHRQVSPLVLQDVRHVQRRSDQAAVRPELPRGACAPRGRCCSPRLPRTCGPIPPASSKCCAPRRPSTNLLGVEGLEAADRPQPGAAPVLSRLGYALREGPHAMGPEDWAAMFAFADKWLK